MTIGIYVLYYETDNNKYYVGQSVNIENRYREHCNKLRAGNHINLKLSNDYLFYKHLPTMHILEQCSLEHLDEREEYWISEFNSYYRGYNNTAGGDATANGYKSPFCLNTKEELENVFNLLSNTDKSYSDIESLTNVSVSAIRKIANGSRHSWLHEQFPDLWEIIKNKIGRTTALYEDKEIYVKIMLDLAYSNDTLDTIARKYGANISTIKNINYGAQHAEFLKSKDCVAWNAMVNKQRKKGLQSSKVLVSPDNAEYPLSLYNIKDIATEFLLSHNSLYKVTQGITKEHKGWKLK